MKSYERIWTALNLEEPDRIPTHTINIDGNVADEILGRPKRNAFDIFDELEMKYPDDWVDKINDILLDIEITTFSKAVRAGYDLGFDGVGVQYIPFILESLTEMTDIFGKRHKVRNIEGNPYPDYYGGYIKNREDWEAYPKANMKEEYKKAETHLRRNKAIMFKLLRLEREKKIKIPKKISKEKFNSYLRSWTRKDFRLEDQE